MDGRCGRFAAGRRLGADALHRKEPRQVARTESDVARPPDARPGQPPFHPGPRPHRPRGPLPSRSPTDDSANGRSIPIRRDGPQRLFRHPYGFLTMNNPTTNLPASPAPVKADRTAELRAESRDLIALLQRLGDGEHDDLEVAHDALAEIINLRLQRAALQRELEIIAYANPSRWDADTRDQFQEWAQNRARAALAKLNGDDHA